MPVVVGAVSAVPSRVESVVAGACDKQSIFLVVLWPLVKAVFLFLLVRWLSGLANYQMQVLVCCGCSVLALLLRSVSL